MIKKNIIKANFSIDDSLNNQYNKKLFLKYNKVKKNILKDTNNPKSIYNILNNRELPIYGKGKNSREWIYVADHCEGLLKVFLNGNIGEFYNIGSNKNLKFPYLRRGLIRAKK